MEEGCTGFINTSGEWVIKPQFGQCFNFSDNGLAFVEDPESELFGFINEAGEWVIEPQFAASPYSEHFFSESGIVAVGLPK